MRKALHLKKLLPSIKINLSVITLLVCVSVSPCVAQELNGIPRSIQKPEEIARWFSSEFEYQLKFPNKPQTPEETLALKSGDCDDFASLATTILAQNGIKSKVIIIKRHGLDIMHAICIYKNEDGVYDFISNTKLEHTGESDLVRAVAKFYPDWKKIMTTNDKRDYMETIAIAR